MKRLRGFTLIEVMVALVVGGTCLATIAKVVAIVSLSTERLRAISIAHGDRMRAHRWLRAVASSMRAPIREERFDGGPHQVTFTAAVRTSENGFETVPLQLYAIDGDLHAMIGKTDSIVWRGVESLDLDYLNDRGLASPFLRSWSSSVTLPVALRIRVGYVIAAALRVDTLLVPVGLIP